MKMFKNYKFGAWRKEIRALMTKRLFLLDEIRRHKKLIDYHLDKIKIIKSKTLVSIEKELEILLVKAENDPKGKPFKENQVVNIMKSKMNIEMSLSCDYNKISLSFVEEEIEYDSQEQLKAKIRQKFKIMKDEINLQFEKIKNEQIL